MGQRGKGAEQLSCRLEGKIELIRWGNVVNGRSSSPIGRGDRANLVGQRGRWAEFENLKI